MSTPLTLHTGNRADGRRTLTAHGEIDMTNLAEFRSALAAVAAGAGPVVVDLTGVDYLDSGAINALFTHAEHLHLVCNPLLLPALRISGLAEVAAGIETPGA